MLGNFAMSVPHEVSALMGIACFTGCSQAPLATAEKVDLTRYVGTWYEIARFDQWFEKDAAAVTAEYRARPDGSIDVINSCHKGSIDGPVEQAKGVARVVDPQTNAKLKVWFFWPFEGDYWILRFAPDYSAAAVGSPDRKTLWFLCRSTTMDVKLYEEWTRSLAADGFDVSRLTRTEQPAK